MVTKPRPQKLVTTDPFRSADHVRPVDVDGEGFIETLEKMLGESRDSHVTVV